MKILRQMALVLLLVFIGELLNKVFNIPIPGSIIAMIILLVALLTGIIKLHQVEEISKFLLDHLSFFFIPAGWIAFSNRNAKGFMVFHIINMCGYNYFSYGYYSISCAIFKEVAA